MDKTIACVAHGFDLASCQNHDENQALVVDVADAEPLLDQTDGVNRTGGFQRHVRQWLGDLSFGSVTRDRWTDFSRFSSNALQECLGHGKAPAEGEQERRRLHDTKQDGEPEHSNLRLLSHQDCH